MNYNRYNPNSGHYEYQRTTTVTEQDQQSFAYFLSDPATSHLFLSLGSE